jgi:hypothetical protein
VDNGFPVDVIYLDFAKAFDKVPHQRLLAKLEAHGVRGVVLQWIRSWLRGRKQRVVVNGAMSEWSDVISGVPQGSVLGPILFIVFVNDLDLGITGNLLKFADDTKLYLSLKNDEATALLQEDLRVLCQWSHDWQMLFNAAKCSVLHVGHNNPGASYEFGGVTLAEVTEARDLGVIVHQSLKPSCQCLQAAKKANRVLGMIHRTITNKSPKIMVKLYKQLVRPHLEYAIQAWSPWLQKDIQLLESVQRRATRMISGFRDLPYEERLRRLHLMTLERRRERGDVIEAYKIMKALEDVDTEEFFALDAVGNPHATRGHALKMRKQHARLDLRKNFFSCRAVSAFNALPPPAVLAQNVLQFKCEISQLYSRERDPERR